MGRIFSTRYNANRIDHNIARQQQVQGTNIEWWFYRPDETVVIDPYDEADIASGGKRFHGPYLIPVYDITRVEGSVQAPGEGFQTYDTVRMVLGYDQARRAGLLPEVDRTSDGNTHLKDRFVWDRHVWKPYTIVSRGLLSNLRRFTVLVVAQEVTQDEMVDDPDFQISSNGDGTYDWMEAPL